MAELDGRVHPHLVAVFTGTVAEQEVLAHVAFFGDLEVEHSRQRAVSARVVVVPLGVGLYQRLKHIPTNQHEGSGHALGADKTHGIHGQCVVLIMVQSHDVGSLGFTDARNASHDTLLGV